MLCDVTANAKDIWRGRKRILQNKGIQFFGMSPSGRSSLSSTSLDQYPLSSHISQGRTWPWGVKTRCTFNCRLLWPSECLVWIKPSIQSPGAGVTLSLTSFYRADSRHPAICSPDTTCARRCEPHRHLIPRLIGTPDRGRYLPSGLEGLNSKWASSRAGLGQLDG